MNQAVTITFVPEQVFTWLIVGLIAGVLATALVRGRRISPLMGIVIGLIGALVGGFLFTILQIGVPPSLAGGITLRWIDIITSFIGAVIVLILLSVFYRRR